VTFRGVTLGLVLVVGAVACGDDGEPEAATTTPSTTATTTTTTAPEREPSTTTTAFDPTTVEGEVEAAYLRSWDVYADAVYDLELDEQALAEVFGGDHLATKIDEINRRIENGEAAFVRIDHDYSIELIDGSTAIVVDSYRNHQVLIDPETKQPVEEDPDEVVIDAITLRLMAGVWKVTFLEGLG
jgi:hypothetical protein